MWSHTTPCGIVAIGTKVLTGWFWRNAIPLASGSAGPVVRGHEGPAEWTGVLKRCLWSCGRAHVSAGSGAARGVVVVSTTTSWGHDSVSRARIGLV